MKQLVYATIVVGALSLQACSSAKKEEVKQDAKAAAEETSSKAEDAKGKVKAAAGKAKAEVSAALEGTVKCTSGKDERTIGVKAVGQGCEVVYTKFNEPSSIASASKGTEHCANVVTRIQDNLKNAGFKCE